MSSTTMSTPSTTTRQSRTVNWGQFALVGLGTVIAATLANVLFYYLAGLFVAYDPQFLILTNVSGAVIFTVVPAIVAVLLYAPLLRFTRHAARLFTILAAVVFVVTLIPDFTYVPSLEGVTNGQIAVLVLMHVIAAVVITGMLTRLARRR